ncbi:MAG: FadR/GntR family transcriptional regulator [Paracoccaceae bacterium]
MKSQNINIPDLSTEIAEEIRASIKNNELNIGSRLPSETELAEQFKVSRSTVREALKRLAAQNLIRTQRGASGGAFVKQLSFEEAYDYQITTSTLLLSMNDVSFEIACEARFSLERACTYFAAHRRTNEDIALLNGEISTQTEKNLSDEDFCASDIRFHRVLVDCAKNPVLSYQLAGAIEAMQPLMNMITFSERSREKIILFHQEILEAIIAKDGQMAINTLETLERYTQTLGQKLFKR